MNNSNGAYSISYNKRWREIFVYAAFATLCYVLKCIIFYATSSSYSDIQFTLLAAIPYACHAILILKEFRKMNLDKQHSVLPRMFARTVSSESLSNEKLIMKKVILFIMGQILQRTFLISDFSMYLNNLVAYSGLKRPV